MEMGAHLCYIITLALIEAHQTVEMLHHVKQVEVILELRILEGHVHVRCILEQLL
jgi:hypothetical protein